ncbi:hypothetical protein OAK24_02695, partial [Flavobacteriales bacterium]|nr:hypothetical protein [Flavobacteriales bacterium]
MKKNLLSVCVLLVYITTFAQQQANHMLNDNLKKGYSSMSITPDFTPSIAVTAPTAIWYDDCSNASNWVFTNNSTLNIDWGISMNPSEIPSSDVSPIASATASNGYMFVSSDADGGATDNDGTTISCEFTNATPIDLTGYPAVQLTFEHCFRWWQDTRIVRISPDNGVTWVDIDEITNNAGYTYPNQSSDNPHMSVYDISSVAGGQSEVLVQFYYNDNDIWAWFWGVDDIAISELPENNVSCTDEVMGGWWIGYQTVGGLGQDYTFNPISQAIANPYAFESVVRNGGIQNQDITLHVEVEDDNGANVLSGTSNPLTLASSEQDTLAVTSTLTPSSTGLYTATMWSVGVNSSGVSTYSDTATKMTMVTDHMYGKDNGTADGGYWRISRPVGGFEVSSTYDMYAAADLYTVDVHISDWSIPGALVYATLYEEDVAGGDPIPLDVSDDYTITSNDLGAWVSIPFSSSQSLLAGFSYRISVGSYLSFTDTVGVDVSDGGEYSVDGILDKDGQFSDPIGTPGWYTISDIPMLRMNFAPLTGYDEIKQTIFNVHPNPTNGEFFIELDEVAKYDITINNMLGQTVLSTTT